MRVLPPELLKGLRAQSTTPNPLKRAIPQIQRRRPHRLKRLPLPRLQPTRALPAPQPQPTRTPLPLQPPRMEQSQQLRPLRANPHPQPHLPTPRPRPRPASRPRRPHLVLRVQVPRPAARIRLRQPTPATSPPARKRRGYTRSFRSNSAIYPQLTTLAPLYF